MGSVAENDILQIKESEAACETANKKFNALKQKVIKDDYEEKGGGRRFLKRGAHRNPSRQAWVNLYFAMSFICHVCHLAGKKHGMELRPSSKRGIDDDIDDVDD